MLVLMVTIMFVGHVPLQSLANNLALCSVPPELSSLNRLESRLVSLRVAFMTLVALPSGKQRCIHGPAVNIPINVDKVVTTLPRLPNQTHLIPLKFKRKLAYKDHYLYDFITPQKILDALRWLKMNHPQYSNVTVNDKWSEQCKKQDFDLHAGFMKTVVPEDSSECIDQPIVNTVAVPKQPLMSTGSDRVHTVDSVTSPLPSKEVW